jgi:hypothetical protein
LANKRPWTIVALIAVAIALAIVVAWPPQCSRNQRLAIGETLLLAGCGPIR